MSRSGNRADQTVDRFAFVIHPLSAPYLFNHPFLRLLQWLPHHWIEWAVAYAPPLYLSRITGIVSTATGKRVEGLLYTLGATSRQMMSRDADFTYRRLLVVACNLPACVVLVVTSPVKILRSGAGLRMSFAPTMNNSFAIRRMLTK